MLIICVLWVYAILDRDWIPIKGPLQLVLAIAGPLSALIYFKYASFFLGDVLHIDASDVQKGFTLFDNIILPAGISFFSFQLVAYAIDRYRGVLAYPVGFQTLLLFISFFPQLIAGPIVRFKQVSEAIANLHSFRITAEAMVGAVFYITVGLAFKVLVADSIAHFLKPLTNTPESLGILGLISVVYSYTFQIYFDFYAYSLCAIGLGRLFGFSLPVNFLRPYSSLNPRDFWRRWHVSLSYWIRDYLYYPLGGNNNYVRNIAIIFIACGLWHGAGYSFVLWGAYHALLVGGYHLIREYWDRMPITLQWVINFSLVSFGWILFVYDLDGFAKVLSSVISEPSGGLLPSLDLVVTVFISAGICFYFRAERMADALSSLRIPIIPSVLYGVLLSAVAFLAMLFFNRSETFIYFRF